MQYKRSLAVNYLRLRYLGGGHPLCQGHLGRAEWDYFRPFTRHGFGEDGITCLAPNTQETCHIIKISVKCHRRGNSSASCSMPSCFPESQLLAFSSLLCSLAHVNSFRTSLTLGEWVWASPVASQVLPLCQEGLSDQG